MKTSGKFTAIVGSEKYRGIHGFGDTAEESIAECMTQVIQKASSEDEIIVGFWTPTGTLPAKNMWMRHTRPT